ncbi:PACE efflux transporter [Vibrio sp.]|uniref:PACE efflux transporter n=1 Tax=Vibrio sp. TaxID=678 RepID=UPI003D131C2E
MSGRERIFHAVLFELIAILMIVPLSGLVTENGKSMVVALSIGLSVCAVVWNYVYNLMFDAVMGADRESRRLGIRIVHAFVFEGGLVLVSVPAIAIVLNVDLWTALLYDASLLIFFFFYTIAYNWLYDKLTPYQRFGISSLVEKQGT